MISGGHFDFEPDGGSISITTILALNLALVGAYSVLLVRATELAERRDCGDDG